MADLKKVPLVERFPETNAPKTITILAGDRQGDDVPESDPDFVLFPDVLRQVLIWWNKRAPKGDFLYLTGPSSTGKSSLAREIAARLGIGLHEMNAHSRLEFPEMVSTRNVIDGDTVSTPGPLTRAYSCGELFLLNEQDLLDPATAAGLNDIGRQLEVIETGQVYRPEPGFGAIFTANTNGGGDDTGQFLGTMQQNLALMDRCFLVQVGYPDVDTEMGIVAKHCGLGKDIIKGMVEFANDVRSRHTPADGSGGIEVTFSTRALLRWAETTEQYASSPRLNATEALKLALDNSLSLRAKAPTRNALLDLVDQKFSA